MPSEVCPNLSKCTEYSEKAVSTVAWMWRSPEDSHRWLVENPKSPSFRNGGSKPRQDMGKSCSYRAKQVLARVVWYKCSRSILTTSHMCHGNVGVQSITKTRRCFLSRICSNACCGFTLRILLTRSWRNLHPR